jgi:Sulfotransferase family
MEEYLALFAPAGPGMRAGEASPQYLRYPEVPPAIAEIQPDAKIIVLLREPADFLRSFHGQMMHGRAETEKDFRAAIELEPARRRGECLPRGCNRPNWLFYSDHVRYAEQLSWYHASFPREQVLVLIYEDYRDDNQGVVRDVLRFLDVDDRVPIEQTRTSPNGDVRLQRLHRLTTDLQEARRSPQAVHPAVRALNAAMPEAFRKALGSRWRRIIYRPPREPDPTFLAELRCRFKPEVEAVSEYLGRDLVSRWGYDRLG